MTEFVLLYRGAQRPTSPEDGQQVMQKWMEWFRGLAEQGKLIDRGQPLEMGGKVIEPASKAVIDGPFAEAKDIVGGYSLVKANDLDEATELAKGCPVLDRGGSVEVRPVMQLNL
jgi:hypothetical protein